MKRRAIIGRGDLLRALWDVDEARCDGVAVRLGYVGGEDIPLPARTEIPREGRARPDGGDSVEAPISEAPPDLPVRRHRYLVPVHVESKEPVSGPGLEVFGNPLTAKELERSPAPLPQSPSLAPWSRVWPWLKNALGRSVSGRRLDVRRIVADLAAARPFKQIPRETRIGWAERACVLLDRRNDLAPFWTDCDEAVRRIKRLRGGEGLRVGLVGDVNPESGTPTLVLGDLGSCPEDAGLWNAWMDAGRLLRRQGNRISALIPCPRDRWNPEIASLWRGGCWNRFERLTRGGQRASRIEGKPESAKRAARLRRLLILLSPAVRIEPGLLRLMSRICGGGAGLEYDAWNHPEMARTPLAAALLPDAALRRRAAFQKESAATRAVVMRLLENYHGRCAPTLRARETLNLAAGGAPISDARIAQARETLQRANAAMFAIAQSNDEAEAKRTELFEWNAREIARTAEGDREEDKEISIGWAISQYWKTLGNREGGLSRVPKGMKPEKVAWVQNLLGREPDADSGWEIWQRGDRLYLQRASGGMKKDQSGRDIRAGWPLGGIVARRLRFDLALVNASGGTGKFQILTPDSDETECVKALPEEIRFTTDRAELRFQSCERPAWAKRMGYDRFGLYADLEVSGVRFRMRWIPPGRFLMGSPEDEAGRESREGPRHEVTISRGYWLAETQCTQALWEAVMGENPSQIKGGAQPVETVSWDECMTFCERLKKVDASFSDLHFRLPSEAEWEYACRAGTGTAFSDGSDCTNPGGIDPALEKLGWHSEDIGDRDPQAVKGKLANNWGLYDMHGNVWEWCLDGQRDYRDQEEQDPVGPMETGALRVLRGGSAWYDARNCRSACRVQDVPGLRNGFGGFRLASGQPPGSGATGRSEG